MVFIAKSFSLVMWFYLPKEGVNSVSKTDFVMPYMRYSVDDFKLKVSELKVVDRANVLSIDSIILKAIYLMGEESFIVAAPKNNMAKSKTISEGDIFEGYTLKKVFTNYVIFERSFKQYRLYITKPKEDKRWKQVQKADAGPQEVRRIASSEVKKAIANPTNIWKNIGLRPHSSAGKQDGFKVSFVRKGTVFEALGLKVGDVIIGVNNKELKNNAQAFSAYQELKNTKALKLSIKRGNTPMELEYEIY
ncbi:PDZ domain-containing protein [Sulfurimonas sp. MAG313]|nr:PDZ domain-containing protein [Sulfurimonas sp. MAG313]MDF1879704.1 PDZ domain-containing protein [Sulfurimonas sp. MAG313]